MASDGRPKKLFLRSAQHCIQLYAMANEMAIAVCTMLPLPLRPRVHIRPMKEMMPLGKALQALKAFPFKQGLSSDSQGITRKAASKQQVLIHTIKWQISSPVVHSNRRWPQWVINDDRQHTQG